MRKSGRLACTTVLCTINLDLHYGNNNSYEIIAQQILSKNAEISHVLEL